jgi:ABC-2 type transport system ATP-binding protein
MITVNKITKKFKDHLVLDIEHLIINSNEKVAIVGQNGAGKTTLAEIILGTQEPTSGKVEFDRKHTVRNAVFQETGFAPEISIYSVAKFYADIFNCRDVNLDELFEKFDIKEVKRKRYQKLSGGQKQKFKLLIALMNNPKLLLLDELTTSLDYVWRQKIFKLLNTLTKDDGIVLMISHDPEEIANLCDRVILIENTKIKKDFKLSGDFKNKVQTIREELRWDETVN